VCFSLSWCPIRELLDLEVDPSSPLPPDDSAYGFDNVADALGVTMQLEDPCN
jgi:hypothetical protein